MIQLIAVVQTQGKTANQDKRVVLWVVCVSLAFSHFQDDHPENNTTEANKAKKELHIGNCLSFVGVLTSAEVVQKTDTKSAQDYLNNHDTLNTDTRYCHFRVITDLYRDGEGETAGQNLIKWLRDNSWGIPVLVYCSNTLNVLHLQAQNSFVLGILDVVLFFKL